MKLTKDDITAFLCLLFFAGLLPLGFTWALDHQEDPQQITKASFSHNADRQEALRLVDELHYELRQEQRAHDTTAKFRDAVVDRIEKLQPGTPDPRD